MRGYQDMPNKVARGPENGTSFLKAKGKPSSELGAEVWWLGFSEYLPASTLAGRC